MKINLDVLKSLKHKLVEYSKENEIIAEHASENINYKCGCSGSCTGNCYDSCLNGEYKDEGSNGKRSQ